jgi:hypothetical protein
MIASRQIAQTRSSDVLVPSAEYEKYPSFTAGVFGLRSRGNDGTISTNTIVMG